MSGSAQSVRLATKLRDEGHAIYLGRDTVGPVFGTREDHLLVVGPPRSGKTSRILTPTVAGHPGPVLAISTRSDLLIDTHNVRSAIADAFGGSVRQLGLAGSVVEPALETQSWDLTNGCEHWETARDRAAMMVGAAVPPNNNDTIWRDSASIALAGALHGAALCGHSGSRMAAKIRSADLGAYSEVVRSLDPVGDHPSSQAFAWLTDDRVIAPNTRRSVFFVLSQQVLGAFDYPAINVGRATAARQLVAEAAGTTYLTIPFERRTQIAPLVVAFVESVIAEWRRQRRETPQSDGRTLLIVLDEAANISPLQSLPSLLTSGAGDGIQVVFALQESAQAEVWGTEAGTILRGSKLLSILPGLRDVDFLQSLAELTPNQYSYDPVVSVKDMWVGGERNATAERLIAERQELERLTAGAAANQHHRIRVRAVREIATRRRADRIQTRSDGTATPFSVLEEIMSYTDVDIRSDRRTSLEANQLSDADPNTVGLFTGAEYRRLRLTHWRDDPFWRTLLPE